jgi:hypothetical protein
VPSSTDEVSVTTCQRCQLPMIGDPFVFTLQGTQTRQNLVICEPCMQSLQRWVHSSGPRASNRITRRKRTADVVDSLISHRRSKFGKRVDRFVAHSRRHVVFYGACALLLGIGLLASLTAFFVVTEGWRVRGPR